MRRLALIQRDPFRIAALCRSALDSKQTAKESEEMTDHGQPFSCVEIDTPRLDLVPVTVASLQCQLGFTSGMYSSLSQLLQAEIPAEWPHENWEPHVLDYLLNLLTEHPESLGWCRYLLLRERGRRILIGTFGCGLPQAETGEAELGYGLLPAWQRQGLAAEAVQAMMPWIVAQQPIRAFVAHTYPELRGSIRVLEKCGFLPAGPGLEERTVLYRRSVP